MGRCLPLVLLAAFLLAGCGGAERTLRLPAGEFSESEARKQMATALLEGGAVACPIIRDVPDDEVLPLLDRRIRELALEIVTGQATAVAEDLANPIVAIAEADATAAASTATTALAEATAAAEAYAAMDRQDLAALGAILKEECDRID